MLWLTFVVLAAGSPRDAHYEVQTRAASFDIPVREGCVLRSANRLLQWVSADGVALGPAAFIAPSSRADISIVAAGDFVFAVAHARGRVLAKVTGLCASTEVVTPPRTVRVVDVCKAFKAPAAFFTGHAREGLYDFGDRVRLDLATAAHLACIATPATDVTADLAWQYEDIGFFEARKAFAGSGALADSYASPEMVEARLRDLVARYPDSARLETIATTHQGRPVYALAVGSTLQVNDPRPTLLLNGAHHGDELLSTSVVLDAARALLEDPKLGDIKKAFVIWCVPLVNPDGLANFLDVSVRAGRKNGRDADNDGQRGIHDGVDLNRNYPFAWRATVSAGPDGDNPLGRTYPGPSAGSEPETQGMMRLADREGFVGALSYHMGTYALLVPYTVSSALDPSPNEALTVATQIAGKLPVKEKIYEVDGTDQDWHRFAHGTLAYVAEIAAWPPPLELAARREAIAPARALWIALARRFIKGPSLQTHDPSRIPVQTLPNGEVWGPRARDGLVSRYLSKAAASSSDAAQRKPK